MANRPEQDSLYISIYLEKPETSYQAPSIATGVWYGAACFIPSLPVFPAPAESPPLLPIAYSSGGRIVSALSDTRSLAVNSVTEPGVSPHAGGDIGLFVGECSSPQTDAPKQRREVSHQRPDLKNFLQLHTCSYHLILDSYISVVLLGNTEYLVPLTFDPIRSTYFFEWQ